MRLTEEMVEDLKRLHPEYNTIESVTFNNDTWYRVWFVSQRCRSFIKDADPDLWYEEERKSDVDLIPVYRIHEKLYTLLALKWK